MDKQFLEALAIQQCPKQEFFFQYSSNSCSNKEQQQQLTINNVNSLTNRTLFPYLLFINVLEKSEFYKIDLKNLKHF